MDDLKISLIQTNLFWEDTDRNLEHLAAHIAKITEPTDLIVLPEMFSTAFSMSVETLAEEMNGKTMQWMLDIAQRHRCEITGSLIIKDEGKFYNRLIWMRPDATFDFYDKRHLFAMGNEHHAYTAGDKPLIVTLNGWKICPMICYDLRFPVWMRNQNEVYDLLLIVANWPEKRSLHWRTLIPARAVENLSYVAAVNRIGNDGNDIAHIGDSMVISPNGETLYHKQNDEDVFTLSLSADELLKTRRYLPFLKDADNFELK